MTAIAVRQNAKQKHVGFYYKCDACDYYMANKVTKLYDAKVIDNCGLQQCDSIYSV